MVNLSESEIGNQPKGNKRQFANSDFNNDQDRNQRGGQGYNNAAKFKRPSFGDRPPFNKGNNRNFNQWNKGEGDRYNNRGPRNFNRGGYQNSNGRQNFNPNFNKPWQNKNRNFQHPNNKPVVPDENDLTESQHKKFNEDVHPEQVNTTTAVDTHSESENDSSIESDENQNANLTTNNLKIKVDEGESEDEIEIESNQDLKNKDQPESSESEDEMEVNTIQNDAEHKQHSSKKITLVKEKTNADYSNNEDEGISSIEKQENTVDTISAKDRIPDVTFVPKLREVHVAGFPPTMQNIHIQEFFAKYGKIESVSSSMTQRNKIFALIMFEKREDALKALEVNGMQYQKEHIIICKATDRKYDFNPNKSITVTNISADITKIDLWTAYESLAGPIRELQIQYSNCAYIEFDSPDSLEVALHKKKFLVKNKLTKISKYVKLNRKQKLERHASIKRGSGRFPKKQQKIQVHKNKNNSFTITLGRGSY